AGKMHQKNYPRNNSYLAQQMNIRKTIYPDNFFGLVLGANVLDEALSYAEIAYEVKRVMMPRWKNGVVSSFAHIQDLPPSHDSIVERFRLSDESQIKIYNVCGNYTHVEVGGRFLRSNEYLGEMILKEFEREGFFGYHKMVNYDYIRPDIFVFAEEILYDSDILRFQDKVSKYSLVVMHPIKI
ncbi:MAG: hypothetical protein NDI94_03185, partial [Candidatus Woesearchaeota archaeon]|nr:hypothetical protein [Candidatus Woesearchaeota archaeon]